MASLYSNRSRWARFGVAVAVSLLVALFRWTLVPIVGLEQPLALCAFAVIAAAWWGGFSAGVVATFVSAALGVWAFMEPRYSMAISGALDRARVIIFLILGVGLAALCDSILRVVRRSREQEAALHRSNQRLDLLAESIGVLLRTESPRAVVNVICQKVMAFIDCQAFLNYLLDEDAGRLRLNAFAGIPGKEAQRVEWLEVGESICGTVARDGKRIVTGEIESSSEHGTDSLKAWGIRAYACHPLVVGDQLLGTIAFGTRTRAEFTEDELSLMKTLSDHVAIAIHRTRTSEELRASDDRYRAFVETSLEAIWRLELDEPLDTRLPVDEQIDLLFQHASYAEANDAMARLYGYEKGGEVKGIRMSDVESASHQPTVDSFRKFITDGYRRSGEVSHERNRHGEIRNFLNNYVGILEGDFLVRVWGSSLDVTERMKAEEALNERTALLHGISENVTDLIFAKDREGRMIFANPATLKVVQRQSGEVLGRTDLEWSMHTEQSQKMVDNDRRVLAEGRAQKFDEVFGDKVFEAVKAPLRDVAGNIIGVVGVARDVTELKKAQAALLESEERFRLMADSAPVLIWVADSEKGRTWVNQQWLSFTGRALEEEVGEGWTKGIHPDDLAQCRQTYTGYCQRWVPFRVEYRLRGANGEYRWLLDSAAPRFGGDGEFLGYLGSCVDITERKHAEAELAKAIAVAEAANRTKDHFLAILSHELRTPLTPVMLIASDFITNPEVDEETRADWSIVYKNISLQARLIDDLLDLTRVARGKLLLHSERFDLHDVIEDALATVQGEVSAKQQALSVHLDAKRRQVQGDPARLQQVFWNVLQNAVKFTPPRGSIELHTSNVNGDGLMRVEITDSGLGLTEEELRRIFDTFSQGDHSGERGSAYGGLGLGLAITRELIELHKGRISASSRGRDQGAVFTIELPTVAELE